MNYETNTTYYIIRYDSETGEQTVLRRVNGLGKAGLLHLIKYYEEQRYPKDTITVSKEIKV